ncbi:hypothetical protein ACSBR1_024526 [Camellia fascicularis]
MRRIYYAHPSSGESYEDIRIINNILYPTFKEASNALGLLDDDNEWYVAIQEACQWSTGHRLHEMFMILLLFCEVANSFELWNRNSELLSDDIKHMQRQLLNDPNFNS